MRGIPPIPITSANNIGGASGSLMGQNVLVAKIKMFGSSNERGK